MELEQKDYIPFGWRPIAPTFPNCSGSFFLLFLFERNVRYRMAEERQAALKAVGEVMQAATYATFITTDAAHAPQARFPEQNHHLMWRRFTKSLQIGVSRPTGKRLWGNLHLHKPFHSQGAQSPQIRRKLLCECSPFRSVPGGPAAGEPSVSPQLHRQGLASVCDTDRLHLHHR